MGAHTVHHTVYSIIVMGSLSQERGGVIERNEERYIQRDQRDGSFVWDWTMQPQYNYTALIEGPQGTNPLGGIGLNKLVYLVTYYQGLQSLINMPGFLFQRREWLSNSYDVILCVCYAKWTEYTLVHVSTTW